MKELIRTCYNKYPESLVCDMVKFIYQNEFGGGHMITDEERSLSMIKEELDNSFPDDTKELFFDLGNNLVRLNLKKTKVYSIRPETINRFFVNTANNVVGNKDTFEEKLKVFTSMVKTGDLPFNINEVDDYIKEYKAAGYPPVSHSEEYKKHYDPSYRVINKRYADFFMVFNKTDELLGARNRISIAIEGNSCAGKSSLAALLGSCYDANIFHMDDFFLPLDLRTDERLAAAGGNVHYERFISEIAENLSSEEEFYFRPFDCSTMGFKEPVRITPKALNIVEGSYCMHPQLQKYYDFKIFLSIDEREQLKRLYEREPEFMHKKFINIWIPMENRYFEAFDIPRKCDLIF